MAQLHLIGRGGTADVYAWGDGQVLKLFFDWVPGGWIQREAEIALRVSKSGLPTPKLFEVTTYQGRKAIIYERIAGATMLRMLSSQPWTVVRHAKDLARLHAQINQQSGAGLPAIREEMERKIKAVDLPEDLRHFALNALSSLPDGSSLCHYDFHPDQVMVGPNGLMILDWMAALQGSPHADVAHTANLLTLARPPQTSWLIEKMIDTARGIFFQSYKRETLALRPELDWEIVERWRVPAAAARLSANIPGEKEPILRFLRRDLNRT